MITVDPSKLDDAALEAEICTTFARRDAESHRLLALIREHDARGTWCGWGIRSCAHWLMWRCGLEAGTAREKVRVARALGALPTFDAMLRTGELSYSKVRAATRVATPEKEAELARLAKITTAAQLESVCRGIRQVEDVRAEETARDAGDEAPARPERWVRLKNGESGMMRLEAQLHPDECAMVMEAIEQARGLQTARHEEPAGPGLDASAESAPGEAWERGKPCNPRTETSRWDPAGTQSCPAKVGSQPEPSVAWFEGDLGCEAYTGSARAA